MKKGIVVLLLMVGMTAIAQRGNHRNGMKNMTAEQIATLETKKLTLALDLTKEQQTKIQAIHLENAKIRKAKMEERNAKKDEGERKKPTSEERYTMQNERLDRMIAHKAEMKKILSEEQYMRWEKMANRKGKHRKQKGERGHRATRR